VSKPLWFFLLPSYWFGARKSKKSHKTVTVAAQNDEQVFQSKPSSSLTLHQMDEDVQKERAAVLSGNLPGDISDVLMLLTLRLFRHNCSNRSESGEDIHLKDLWSFQQTFIHCSSWQLFPY
jgi:hypothetical protein